MNSDFKASDIEVGFSSVSEPLFRKLKVAEIEAVLAEMHDANWYLWVYKIEYFS